jgi:DNA repair exonuclease SbcCD ATPase subunit
MPTSSQSQDLGKLQTLTDMYKNKQSQVYNEILQLKRTAENLEIHMDRTIDELRNVILSGSKQVSAQLAANMDGLLNSTRELTITQHRGVDEISEKLSDLETSITRLQSEMRGASSLQRVLQSLYFERFRARHDQIPKAHTKTLDWVFEDGAAGHHDSLPSKFLHWLEKRNGIFWIRGKVGSGKSTLLKTRSLSSESTSFGALGHPCRSHERDFYDRCCSTSSLNAPSSARMLK